MASETLTAAVAAAFREGFLSCRDKAVAEAVADHTPGYGPPEGKRYSGRDMEWLADEQRRQIAERIKRLEPTDGD